MKDFILETHACAPELNTVHFPNGATLDAANLRTAKEVKDFFFKPASSIEKHILIEVIYPCGERRVVARGFMPRGGYRFIKRIISADRPRRSQSVTYSIKSRMCARYASTPIAGA